MPGDIEGEVAQTPFAPTDDSAMAWIEGGSQKVEQSGAQAPTAPAPKEQAPAPTAPTASPDVASIIEEKLKAALNPLQSELGQLRKVRSEFEKFRSTATQPTTPTSWQQMKPEEQAAVLELVEHAWKQKFGDKWEMVNSHFEQMQQREALNSVEATAREIAGDQWKELDPIMGRLYTDLVTKAEQGDQQAQRLAYEVANTYSGVAHLVALAKQELSQTVQATEQKAVVQRQAQAKKAGTALSAAPANAGGDAEGLEALKNMPTAKLREYLLKHGAL